MSFAQASKKKEDVAQGGSNHITSSGFFPITLLAPVVSKSKGGSESVDVFVDHQGQKQIVFGNLRVTNNDGSPNKIGAKIFNQLLIIADVDQVADPVDAELPIGKKGAMKPCAVLEDLADLDVVMRIQMEYSKFNGDIKEKKIIKSFFRAADNATAEEIVNDETPGAGYVREGKYENNVTYKDGLDEATVAQWITDKRPTGTAGADGGGAPEKAPSFGSKRFGNKTDE